MLKLARPPVPEGVGARLRRRPIASRRRRAGPRSCFQQGRRGRRSPQHGADLKHEDARAYDFNRHRDEGNYESGAYFRSGQSKCRERAIADHRDDE